MNDHHSINMVIYLTAHRGNAPSITSEKKRQLRLAVTDTIT